MPLLTVGGILTGIYTPTEAAGAGVFYSLVIGFFVYRELKLKHLWPILKETAIMSGGDYAPGCKCFSLLVDPHSTRESTEGGRWDSVPHPEPLHRPSLGINLFLLFMGCIMETLATIIILVPVLLPLIKSLGIDPVHFGVLMVVNLSIGLATPPVGVNLFVPEG